MTLCRVSDAMPGQRGLRGTQPVIGQAGPLECGQPTRRLPEVVRELYVAFGGPSVGAGGGVS